MNKNNNSTLMIKFVDGTTEYYEFKMPEVNPLTFAGQLDKALSRNQIIIQCADRLRIIPMQSVKSCEFTIPPHPKLPELVFSNARLVTDM